MNASIAAHLSLILFFPTFCIVAALYCWLPLQPRNVSRWLMDVCVIALSFVLSIVAMHWGFQRADGIGSPIWKQAASLLSAYAAFFGVLALGLVVRALVWKRNAAT